MNRFHLLSVDEDESSAPVSVPEPSNTTPSASATPAKKAVARDKKEIGRNDRKSRGVVHRGGEKHSTVGKGSWGRHADGAAPESNEDTEAVEEAAPEAEQPAAPKPVYKTVEQYLAEQAEQQRRLTVLTTTPQGRRANDGADIDSDLQVIRKESEVLQFGSAPAKKAAAAAPPKESTNKRLTLQELNKVLPPAEPRRDREPRKEDERSTTRRKDDSRPARRDGDTPRRDGDAPRRERDAPRRSAEDRASRPQGKDNRFADKKPSFAASAKIDLSDKNAFPSLA